MQLDMHRNNLSENQRLTLDNLQKQVSENLEGFRDFRRHFVQQIFPKQCLALWGSGGLKG